MTLVDHPSATTDDDPAAWLLVARRAEPALRLVERTAALDRVEALLTGAGAHDSATRDRWHELWAERAVDAARLDHRAEASALADRVLTGSTRSLVAIARAWEARGRVEAWTGTDAATQRADRILRDVAGRYAALGETEWQAQAVFWRGNAVFLQNGDLDTAATSFAEALAILPAISPRRATVLTFAADLHVARGEWDAAERHLAEAAALAVRDDDAKTRAYASWSAARMASSRGDAAATERHLREVEREAGDWFTMHTGVAFLADAAELLDRVGLHEYAATFLARAEERDRDDPFVRQARATLLARTGDPVVALDALQQVVRGDWLEKRLRWRHTLFTAWAAYRLGRPDAGTFVVRALEQAHASGGVQVALATEPELVRALLPLAEETGSAPARALLLAGRAYLVRLLGRPRVTRADGTEVTLPVGKPAELVRLLAAHPLGLDVEAVCDGFFPDADVTTARHRLRQVLARLRAADAALAVREEDRLVLAPAWVDAREFLDAAARVRTSDRAQQVERAYAALALWGGEPLATDSYGAWASELRGQLDARYLTLLDIVAGDAERHGAHEQAVSAITAALGRDPHDLAQYERLAGHLLALGRHATAQYLARLAGLDLDLPPPSDRRS